MASAGAVAEPPQGPCVEEADLWLCMHGAQVVQVKTPEREGYLALQLGCGAKRAKRVHYRCSAPRAASVPCALVRAAPASTGPSEQLPVAAVCISLQTLAHRQAWLKAGVRVPSAASLAMRTCAGTQAHLRCGGRAQRSMHA